MGVLYLSMLCLNCIPEKGPQADFAILVRKSLFKNCNDVENEA